MREQAAQLLQSIIEQAASQAMGRATCIRRGTRQAGSRSAPITSAPRSANRAECGNWRDRAMAGRPRQGRETVEIVQHTVADSASEIRCSARAKEGRSGRKEEAAWCRWRASGRGCRHVVGELRPKAADTGKDAAAQSAPTPAQHVWRCCSGPAPPAPSSTTPFSTRSGREQARDSR